MKRENIDMQRAVLLNIGKIHVQADEAYTHPGHE